MGGQTDGHLRPTLLGRLGGVDLQNTKCTTSDVKVLIFQFAKISGSVFDQNDLSYQEQQRRLLTQFPLRTEKTFQID